MGRARCLSHAARRAGCLCLAVVFTMNPVPVRVSAGAAFDQRAAAAMQQFLDGATTPHQYSASRRLEASGSGHQGWLDVQTEFTAASGFFYQVTAEGGSGYIRSRVLRSLLDEEQSVIARKALTPLDLERDFGLIGGDIFHGAMTLDQIFSARPMLGYADYRSPVAGLYLCGSGTHPGGGVTGAPGHNAAKIIAGDLRRRR